MRVDSPAESQTIKPQRHPSSCVRRDTSCFFLRYSMFQPDTRKSNHPVTLCPFYFIFQSFQASGWNDGLLQQQQPDRPLLLLHETTGQERQRERGDAHTRTHTQRHTHTITITDTVTGRMGLLMIAPACEQFSNSFQPSSIFIYFFFLYFIHFLLLLFFSL